MPQRKKAAEVIDEEVDQQANAVEVDIYVCPRL